MSAVVLSQCREPSTNDREDVTHPFASPRPRLVARMDILCGRGDREVGSKPRCSLGHHRARRKTRNVEAARSRRSRDKQCWAIAGARAALNSTLHFAINTHAP